jgi:hypothetical protein
VRCGVKSPAGRMAGASLWGLTFKMEMINLIEICKILAFFAEIVDR